MKRKNRKFLMKKPAQVKVQQQQTKKGEGVMRNSIEPKIMQHIIEKPQYLDKVASHGSVVSKYLKIAETLKIIESTKCMSWDEEEFINQFGVARTPGQAPNLKRALAAMRAGLTKCGIKKPRVIPDHETHQIFVFRNDK